MPSVSKRKMGACASVPKAMKEEAAAAAAPPPEEKPQVEAPAIVAVDAAVAKEIGGDDKNEEKEESQSLGTLLVEVSFIMAFQISCYFPFLPSKISFIDYYVDFFSSFIKKLI